MKKTERLAERDDVREWVEDHYLGVEEGCYTWVVNDRKHVGANDVVVESFRQVAPDVVDSVQPKTARSYLGQIAHHVTGDVARPDLTGRDRGSDSTGGDGEYRVQIKGPGLTIDRRIDREEVPELVGHLV